MWTVGWKEIFCTSGTKSNLIRKYHQYQCINQILQGLDFLYWYLKQKRKLGVVSCLSNERD